MKQRLKRTCAVLSLAALVVLVGCGSGSGGPEPAEKVPTGGAGEAPPEERRDDAAAKEADGDFVGLPLEEARALAEARDLRHRVTWRDGDALPATADYLPDRVNFEVEDGKVIGVTRG